MIDVLDVIAIRDPCLYFVLFEESLCKSGAHCFQGQKGSIVLFGGFIRVVVSLGSQPLTLTMSRGPRLDDSQWHSIEVRQELKV